MIQQAPASLRNPIRILPPLVVNQIAAGEVVERPASVVKELIDNAIDAHASRITIDLDLGGIELIRIADDGRGIPADQLALAIHPHATSKILSTQDLDAVRTMGFRGEALASIASVSRLTLRSRSDRADAAAEIRVEGETTSDIRPAAGSVGTTVTVANLFFNTPARRKFLRTPITEQSHCANAIRDLALAHPAIGFLLRADGRTLFDLPPGQSPRERAFAILGDEHRPQYLEAHADQFDDARGAALWGLIGMPILAKPHTRCQHFFVNGRPIRDKSINHAAREAYRGLIEPGRHPAAILMLELAPAAVDVNVHPAKAEVRFRDAQLIHRIVHTAVREALRRADLTPSDTGSARSTGWRFETVIPAGGAASHAPSDGATSHSAGPAAASFLHHMREQNSPPPHTSRFDFTAPRTAPSPFTPPPQSQPNASPLPSHPAPHPDHIPAPIPIQRILQVHNSFVITQDAEGLIIIDQHALHERVMFEKLRARIDAGPLEAQSMLVPATISVTQDQSAALDALEPLLAKLSITADHIGPRAIAIHAFPTLLLERGVDPAEFLIDLLDRAAGGDLAAPDTEPALHEVLDMMACKAAIKAGDRLSDHELDELLRLRDSVERSSACPHGRPTAIRLSIHELERQFGRSPRRSE